jgi:hypothetical protein
VNTRVTGYHGCDLKTAMAIVARKQALKPGKEHYDWLGMGVYFWEDDSQLALGWAKHTAKRRPELIQTPAVIGAVIDLKDCLNLVQTGASRILYAAYQALALEVERAGGQMPVNETEERRFLDHAVFETLHELRRTEGRCPFSSVRALFQSGEPVFPGSGIRKWDHIQICVRDISIIEGCFLVGHSGGS